MATIKEVAKEAGVSYQAVSAVLNGNLGKASPATRERIFQAAAKLNYRPNTLARALRSGRSHTIGLVVGNLINPGNHCLAEAVMSEAEKHGYRLIVSATRFDRDREREALLHMLHHQVDGIIYNLSAAFDGEFFRQFEEGGVPIVLTSEHPKLPLNSVSCDLHPGSRDAALHLAKLGCRRILCQTGVYDRDREITEKASRESGVPLETFAWNPRDGQAEKVVERFLRERPDALILSSAEKLVELLAKAPDYHPRIVRHYTLPGFFPPGGLEGVIHLPFRSWVERMAESLIARIENPKLDRVRLKIPTEFLTSAKHEALFRKQCRDPYYNTYQ